MGLRRRVAREWLWFWATCGAVGLLWAVSTEPDYDAITAAVRKHDQDWAIVSIEPDDPDAIRPKLPAIGEPVPPELQPQPTPNRFEYVGEYVGSEPLESLESRPEFRDGVPMKRPEPAPFVVMALAFYVVTVGVRVTIWAIRTARTS